MKGTSVNNVTFTFLELHLFSTNNGQVSMLQVDHKTLEKFNVTQFTNSPQKHRKAQKVEA